MPAESGLCASHKLNRLLITSYHRPTTTSVRWVMRDHQRDTPRRSLNAGVTHPLPGLNQSVAGGRSLRCLHHSSLLPASHSCTQARGKLSRPTVLRPCGVRVAAVLRGAPSPRWRGASAEVADCRPWRLPWRSLRPCRCLAACGQRAAGSKRGVSQLQRRGLPPC